MKSKIMLLNFMKYLLDMTGKENAIILGQKVINFLKHIKGHRMK